MNKIISILLMSVLLLSLNAFAIQPAALPEFTVLDKSSAPVKSSTLEQDKKWLLIYLQADCKKCTDLLNTLKTFSDPVLSKRVIIIIGGTNDTVSSFIKARDEIASLQWYTDPEQQAYKTLPVSGTPIVFGINKGTIQWSLAGEPAEAATFQSILKSWIK